VARLPGTEERPPGSPEPRDADAETALASGGDGGDRTRLKADLTTLARGGSRSFIGGIVSAVLGFVFIVVIARGLKAGRAGVFFEALALFNILSNIAELGADTGLVRMIPRFRALKRTQDVRRTIWAAMWPTITASIVLGAAQFFFAPQLSHVFIHKVHAEAAVPYWRVLGVALPLSTISTVAIAATRGFGTVTPYVVISDYTRPALRPVLALFVITAGLGSFALGIAYAVPIAIGFVMGLWWLAKLLRDAERHDEVEPDPPRGARSLAGEFWRFSAPRGMAAAFSVTVLSLDTLLLGALKDTHDAGIYAASTRYLTVGGFALQAILLVIAPQISAMLAKGGHERAEGVFATSTWWLMASSWPIYIAVAVFAPLLLSIFGRQFVAGQTALLILSLAMLVNLATGPVNPVLLMGGKSSWNLINTMASLAVNVGLNLWLIPKIGMTGAALAWAASIVVNNVAALAEVWIFMKLQPIGFGFFLVAGAAAACYGGLGVLARQTLGLGWGAFVLYGVVATGIYAAILWRFREALHVGILREGLRMRGRKEASRADMAQPL
jgi:O-antigen/teichoic acid export membrane protein